MPRRFDRLRDATFGCMVLGILAALVLGLRPDDSPGAPPTVHRCTRAGCPWLDHSPEAATRAQVRDRTLLELDAIDPDQSGSFDPPVRRFCDVAIVRSAASPAR